MGSGIGRHLARPNFKINNLVATDVQVRDEHKKSHEEFLRKMPYARTRSGSLFLPPEVGVDEDDEAEKLHREEHEQFKNAHAEEFKEEDQSKLDDDYQGFVWHAEVRTDDFSDAKHCTNGELKLRRPVPQIKASDLLNKVRKQETSGRWILDEPLNGWPALVGLELVSLTVVTKPLGMVGVKKLKRLWKSSSGKALPTAAEVSTGTRATFRGQTWTMDSWSSDSQGFVWWFSAFREDTPQLLFGEKMLDKIEKDKYAESKAINLHIVAHQYPVEKETARDKLTYHAAVFVEWDHCKFGTLVELAWVNGTGGYGGKSNWIEDKLATDTSIFVAMPDALKQPWDDKRSEIRLIDMAATNRKELEAYLRKYSKQSGLPLGEQRFWDPKIYASSSVRVRNRKPSDIAGYLLDYIARSSVYEQLTANCQTFAADFFAFLTGTRNVEPYGSLVKRTYKQRAHSFLYVPR